MKSWNTIALILIQLYQKTLSPDKWLFSPWLRWKICAHEPHCSEYAKQCFQTYWFRDALVYSFDRIISCSPSSMIKNDPSTYNVVYFSGAHIWVPFLKALHTDPRYNLVWVVTMPDVARDRWQKIKQNIIKEEALNLWLEENQIHTPESLRLNSKKHAKDAKKTTEWLKSLDIDYLVVVAYGKLLPPSILDIPHIAPVNVHGSLLPEYRGASPLQSVFLDGKKESWITIMLMDEGMDTWDMLSKLKTKLPLSWTVNDLIHWIQEFGPAHLLQSLREFAKGDITNKAQEEKIASHCGKIEKKDGQIDLWNDSLQDVYQKYQWYKLWPKISFTRESWGVKKRALIEEILVDETLYEIHKKDACLWLFWNTVSKLKTLNPSIKKLTIKPEWKKAISREEFRTNYLTK